MFWVWAFFVCLVVSNESGLSVPFSSLSLHI